MSSWLELVENKLEAVHLPLGRVEYVRTYHLQARLHELRCQGKIADTVITVEHEPVFTIGRSGSASNVLVPPKVLQHEGISVYDTERGGNITYHGPGQLVVYPIIDLRSQGCDLKRYIRNLEQSVIGFLARLGIVAERRAGFPGVWVGSRKIASVGVYVKRWITRHGLALNVDVNKCHFGMINPCGMNIEVVSLNELTEEKYSLAKVRAGILSQMEQLFGWRFVEGDAQQYWEKDW